MKINKCITSYPFLIKLHKTSTIINRFLFKGSTFFLTFNLLRGCWGTTEASSSLGSRREWTLMQTIELQSGLQKAILPRDVIGFNCVPFGLCCVNRKNPFSKCTDNKANKKVCQISIYIFSYRLLDMYMLWNTEGLPGVFIARNGGNLLFAFALCRI